MTETKYSSSSVQLFLSDVERLLAPVYVDCFSDETRKTRNSLLIISFVLILSSLGLLAISQAPVGVPGFGISVKLTSGIRWVLIALSSYFLILHSARSYSEWNLWRLRHQAPFMELSELKDGISTQLTKRHKTVLSANSLSILLYQKLYELEQDPPEIIDMTKRRDALYSEYQRMGDELRSKENHLQIREYEDEAFKLEKMREDFDRLQDEIERTRKEHRARISAMRDALKRRLHGLDKNPSAEKAASESDVLFAKLEYLADAIRPINRIRSIRFILEVLFPTAFAVSAIVIGILAP